ncbi:MAG TPA: hypothetical protein VNT52_04115 [Acidimicrobiales bacterium]|nr:hypothetical protein [Acidimicrobiales bacterium]
MPGGASVVSLGCAAPGLGTPTFDAVVADQPPPPVVERPQHRALASGPHHLQGLLAPPDELRHGDSSSPGERAPPTTG